MDGQILRRNMLQSVIVQILSTGVCSHSFYEDAEIPFKKDDYIFVPNIADAVRSGKTEIPAYIVSDTMKEFTLKLGEMTEDEREIIKGLFD